MRWIPGISSIALAALAQAQSGSIWSELSTDGIHWHSDWWPTDDLPEYFRIRASWSGVAGARGLASMQFYACVVGTDAGSLMDLAVNPALDLSHQAVNSQDSGGRICAVNPLVAGEWITALQPAPSGNPGFDAENPVTLFTGTIRPPQLNMGSVSIFLNSAAGQGLRIYVSESGSVTTLPLSALSRINATFRGTYAGCVFMDQPEPQTVDAHSTVVLTATVGVPASYKWYRNGAALADGGRLSGTQTIRLTISDAALGDSGDYICVATSSRCTQALASQRAHLTVTCSADFDHSGVLDVSDYLGFVAAFAAGSTAADFNGDGMVDFFDYLDFLQAFADGC